MLAIIWVAMGCNMKCKYCYEGEKKDSKMMDKSSADQVLKCLFEKTKAKTDTCTKIIFHGGEPLLNFEIIQYIINRVQNEYKNFKVQYGITTNGLCLDEKKMDFLVNNIQDIRVSIDGNKMNHDLNRVDMNGNGTYERIIGKFVFMNKSRKGIVARMTIVPETIGNLFDNIVHLINLGFEEIVPAIDYCNVTWNEKKMKQLYNQIIRLREYLPEIDKNSLNIPLVKEVNLAKKKACSGGRESINILPNGDLYPCSFVAGDRRFKCGDIYTGINKEKIAEFDIINNKKNLSCSECLYYDYCTATRCKFMNEKLMNSLDNPSPIVCNYENLKLRLYHLRL